MKITETDKPVYEFAYLLGTKVNNADKADPQVIGEEIDRIRAENDGNITSQIFQDASRDKDAPCHQHFEWNQDEAANKYRNIQAGEIIRSISVVRWTEEGEKSTVRAFSSVPAPGGASNARVYVSTIEAMEDKDDRTFILQEMLNQLVSMRKRWAQINELADELELVDKLVTQVRQKVARAAADYIV